MNIEELGILKELSEQKYFGDLLFSYYADLIGKLLTAYEKEKDKIKAKIEEKFLEAKGLYERGVQPQAQYTMKLLRDLEKSLLEKE